MRARRELGERVFRLCQHLLGFVEPLLVEQRTPEYEPCVADLVEAILPAVEPPQRVARVLLGRGPDRRSSDTPVRATRRPSPRRRRRRARARRRRPPGAGRSPSRASRAGSRGRRGCSAAARRSSGRRAPRTAPSRARRRCGRAPSGRRARRSGTPGSTPRRARGVLHRLGELERALDVLAGGLVVALAAVAARAPGEDVRAQQVGGKLGAVEQVERLAEERDRGRDARDQVAGDTEPEQDLGAVEVGELGPLDEPARRPSSSSAVRTSPFWMRAHASPESSRT